MTRSNKCALLCSDKVDWSCEIVSSVSGVFSVGLTVMDDIWGLSRILEVGGGVTEVELEENQFPGLNY